MQGEAEAGFLDYHSKVTSLEIVRIYALLRLFCLEYFCRKLSKFAKSVVIARICVANSWQSSNAVRRF
ncbi:MULTISPECIES: hypothetical protein [unclassified Campylobacter]|uniref:hypothetical protein n=1 Tax=unclassified Campylobacter TaxID=2593542 RepID=UPI0022EA0E2D|nr:MULTISPECIES: hypothetical protein [unclassified Campylobacter]MDA3065737.1 hypothetical protein [Campylobacter sp. CN_NE4]MDA3068996.1 hypothetical protein [Campylobacter sp. CN_NE3]MDA3083190.1 hypothetical protein [Campylobacter sp. CN_EL2]MDA3084636.1 hypothetical protein [Campylobacter sp. CN_NE1]